MEVRKFAVGIITKWFFFVVCISMMPAFSKGLFTLASQVGDTASGTSRETVSQALSDYYNDLKRLVSKNAEDYEDAIKKLKDAKSKLAKSSRRARIHKQQEIDEKEKEFKEWKDKNRVWKVINSLEDVLIVDGENVTDSYKMDISLKTTNSSGDTVDLGIMSPAAYFKVAVLCCEIMWGHEWTDNVKRTWAENTGIDTEKADWEERLDNKATLFKITDFPLSKIFEMIFCGIIELTLLVVSCVQLVQYLMCVIEYSITSTVCLVLVPCMLFDGTKDMANKILPTLFAQAMKMCMIVICMYFSLWIYMSMLSDVMFTGGISIRVGAYVIFLVILSFALVSNAPKIAATIMTGSPQMSMGEFVQTAGAFAGGVATGWHMLGAGVRTAAGGFSFAGNRAGDLAEAVGAGIKSSKNSAAKGGGDARRAGAFASGFAGNLLSQTGGRLRSAGGNFVSKGTLNPLKAWHGGGGSGGGSGSGGGAGFDRFNQAAKNADGSRNYGKGMDGKPLGANSPGADHSSDRKYGNAYNSNGEKTTYGDWLRARFRAGADSVRVRSAKPAAGEPAKPATPGASPAPDSGPGLPPPPPETGLALRSGGRGGGEVGFFGGGFPKFGSSFSPVAALPDNRLSDAKKEIHNAKWGDKDSAEDAELI